MYGTEILSHCVVLPGPSSQSIQPSRMGMYTAQWTDIPIFIEEKCTPNVGLPEKWPVWLVQEDQMWDCSVGQKSAHWIEREREECTCIRPACSIHFSDRLKSKINSTNVSHQIDCRASRQHTTCSSSCPRRMDPNSPICLVDQEHSYGRKFGHKQKARIWSTKSKIWTFWGLIILKIEPPNIYSTKIYKKELLYI